MESNDILPDFKYSTEMEPQLNWTVGDTLQWVLLKSHEATDLKHAELVSLLEHKFEEGKKALQEMHSQIHENQENIFPNNGSSSDNNQENIGENSGSGIANKRGILASHNEDIRTIHVLLTEGPHASGKTIKLTPKPNQPCWVGRSTGKKYRDRGISLSKDVEVSTTHGKFEVISGKAYYTDTGSTNGSFHKGVNLEPDVPCLLKEDMEFALGATNVRILALTTT